MYLFLYITIFFVLTLIGWFICYATRQETLFFESVYSFHVHSIYVFVQVLVLIYKIPVLDWNLLKKPYRNLNLIFKNVNKIWKLIFGNFFGFTIHIKKKVLFNTSILCDYLNAIFHILFWLSSFCMSSSVCYIGIYDLMYNNAYLFHIPIGIHTYIYIWWT